MPFQAAASDRTMVSLLWSLLVLAAGLVLPAGARRGLSFRRRTEYCRKCCNPLAAFQLAGHQE